MQIFKIRDWDDLAQRLVGGRSQIRDVSRSARYRVHTWIRLDRLIPKVDPNRSERDRFHLTVRSDHDRHLGT